MQVLWVLSRYEALRLTSSDSEPSRPPMAVWDEKGDRCYLTVGSGLSRNTWDQYNTVTSSVSFWTSGSQQSWSSHLVLPATTLVCCRTLGKRCGQHIFQPSILQKVIHLFSKRNVNICLKNCKCKKILKTCLRQDYLKK